MITTLPADEFVSEITEKTGMTGPISASELFPVHTTSTDNSFSITPAGYLTHMYSLTDFKKDFITRLSDRVNPGGILQVYCHVSGNEKRYFTAISHPVSYSPRFRGFRDFLKSFSNSALKSEMKDFQKATDCVILHHEYLFRELVAAGSAKLKYGFSSLLNHLLPVQFVQGEYILPDLMSHDGGYLSMGKSCGLIMELTGLGHTGCLEQLVAGDEIETLTMAAISYPTTQEEADLQKKHQATAELACLLNGEAAIWDMMPESSPLTLINHLVLFKADSTEKLYLHLSEVLKRLQIQDISHHISFFRQADYLKYFFPGNRDPKMEGIPVTRIAAPYFLDNIFNNGNTEKRLSA